MVVWQCITCHANTPYSCRGMKLGAICRHSYTAVHATLTIYREFSAVVEAWSRKAIPIVADAIRKCSRCACTHGTSPFAPFAFPTVRPFPLQFSPPPLASYVGLVGLCSAVIRQAFAGKCVAGSRSVHVDRNGRHHSYTSTSPS